MQRPFSTAAVPPAGPDFKQLGRAKLTDGNPPVNPGNRQAGIRQLGAKRCGFPAGHVAVVVVQHKNPLNTDKRQRLKNIPEQGSGGST